jgi:glycosyltransferase involved in cell wall biosynthesis
MVSVIIPTYNRCAYVREAVESVLAQGELAAEVIVVDDGSTDDTPAALQCFGDRLRYLRQPRSGASSARNRGIRMATREWLAFLDSDDLWLPQKLKAQLEFLDNHPLVKVCQTEEIWIRNGKRINPKGYHRKPDGYCFPLLLERCLVSPSAVMIHSSVLEEVGLFDESLPACEDYDLWLRIGRRYPIALVKQPLIVKRGGHPDQLSTTVPFLDRYRIQAIAKLLRHEPLTVAQRRMALHALNHKCQVYGQGCAKWGRHDEAAAILALPGRLEHLDPAYCVKVSGEQ